MTVRLRYTGALPTSFMTGNVGEVEPNGEFSVPDELVRSFIRLADVEHAGPCPAPPCRCGEEPEAAGTDGTEDGSAESGTEPTDTGRTESGDGEPETRSRKRRTAAQDEDPPAA